MSWRSLSAGVRLILSAGADGFSSWYSGTTWADPTWIEQISSIANKRLIPFMAHTSGRSILLRNEMHVRFHRTCWLCGLGRDRHNVGAGADQCGIPFHGSD